MPARLHRVQQGHDGVRRGRADALLGHPGQLHRFPAVREIDRLTAHGDQHIAAVRPVPGRLREPQCLYEVALGQPVRGDVVRGPAGQPGQIGGGREQPPPGRLPVRAPQHRLRLVLQVPHEGLPGVPAAVGVVEGAEELGDRTQRGDVPLADAEPRTPLGLPLPGHTGGGRGAGRRGRPAGPRGHRPPHAVPPAALFGHDGAVRRVRGGRGRDLRTGRGPHGTGPHGRAWRRPADPLVRPADQPVPAGDDETGRGERDLPQLGLAARVLAPQPADDVDRLGRGRRELQARVDRGAGVQAQVLRGEAAAQASGEDLGDQRGRGAPGLLAPQPAGHGGLVVPQVEAVFEAELVHPAGEAGVGETGLGDERREPAVGRALRRSFRHQL